MAKYKTMLERGSKATFRVDWNKLSSDEKIYIKQGIDRMLIGDVSRGGYGGKFKRYILKGGRLPKPIK